MRTVQEILYDARALIDEYNESVIVLSDDTIDTLQTNGIRFVDMAQKEIYKELRGKKLKDIADLDWNDARDIVKRAVELLNDSMGFDLDPEQPIASYAGRNVDIKVRSGEEIGQLAKSFNQMITDLKITNEEIRSWSIRLEKKIEERTKKLYLARAKLIQSEKMSSMGVLASSVAHEINNPLQGILTYIKLMLKILNKGDISEKNLKEFEDYLILMGTEIERCGDMVKNLLVFSKQSTLEIREEDINLIIKNALKLIEVLFCSQSALVHFL